MITTTTSTITTTVIIIVTTTTIIAITTNPLIQTQGQVLRSGQVERPYVHRAVGGAPPTTHLEVGHHEDVVAKLFHVVVAGRPLRLK